jgi:hypothetical protein
LECEYGARGFPQNSHSISILNKGVLICLVTATPNHRTFAFRLLSEVLIFTCPQLVGECDSNCLIVICKYNHIVGGANLSCDRTVSSVSLEQEVFPQNSHSHSILTLGVLILSVTEQNENE